MSSKPSTTIKGQVTVANDKLDMFQGIAIGSVVVSLLGAAGYFVYKKYYFSCCCIGKCKCGADCSIKKGACCNNSNKSSAPTCCRNGTCACASGSALCQCGPNCICERCPKHN